MQQTELTAKVQASRLIPRHVFADLGLKATTEDDLDEDDKIA